MNKIIAFMKRETVLVVSIVLAIVSAFFVPPSTEYLAYIDFKTLALLFCLMAALAGFSEAGLFSYCAHAMLKRAKGIRGVQLILVMLCFVFSAFITNDVALITFVPFAITVLRLAQRQELIPITVVLQTVAANMGSSLTPIGNPQNIYLYNISELSFLDFFSIMLPYAAVSLAVILICIFFTKKAPISAVFTDLPVLKRRDSLFFGILFVISLLAVLKFLNYILCFLTVLILLLIFKRKTLLKIDYSLLLTFIGFFIFVGNMGNIPQIKNLIEELILGREIPVAALISQIISNVPAALLLSDFTQAHGLLLAGLNIGGLGTLIASMASLISYKYICAELPEKKGKYFWLFSVLNFALLGVLLLMSFVI